MSPRRMHPTFAQRAATRATGFATAGDAASVVRLAVPGSARAGSGGRWGLVLGGGGVLGAAWLVGALEALERARGIDVRRAEIILGTSAGSVIGALLAAGVSVADQRAQQLGEQDPTAELTARLAGVAFDPDRPAGDALPPRPRLRPGSTALLRNNRGSLREIPRTTLLAGLAPAGRRKMVGVAALIEAFVPAGEWTSHPGYRAVALDYETGRRVVFGAPDAPPAGLSDAVLASCAIPGWFEPVTIGGRRYVDGGMWSATNVDLLADAGLDEIFVLAPMASAAYDAPGDWRARVERRLRIASTRRCLAESREVQLRGTAVTVLGPGPEDLQLMGYNLMAPERRRVVLESAVRTGTVAFAEPPAVETQAVAPPSTAVSLQHPLIALDHDVNRSEHG
jgi:predicted acylesterase/phospholipase RssA